MQKPTNEKKIIKVPITIGRFLPNLLIKKIPINEAISLSKLSKIGSASCNSGEEYLMIYLP